MNECIVSYSESELKEKIIPKRNRNVKKKKKKKFSDRQIRIAYFMEKLNPNG